MAITSRNKGSNDRNESFRGSQGSQMHQARSSIKQSIMQTKAVSGRHRAPEIAQKSAGRMIGSIVVSGLFCILSLAVICALAFFCFFN